MYGRVSLARTIMGITGPAFCVYTVGVVKSAHMLLLSYLRSKLVFALRLLLVHALTYHVFGTKCSRKNVSLVFLNAGY